MSPPPAPLRPVAGQLRHRRLPMRLRIALLHLSLLPRRCSAPVRALTANPSRAVRHGRWCATIASALPDAPRRRSRPSCRCLRPLRRLLELQSFPPTTPSWTPASTMPCCCRLGGPGLLLLLYVSYFKSNAGETAAWAATPTSTTTTPSPPVQVQAWMNFTCPC